MKVHNPTDLFFDQLLDILSMESQLSDSMPTLEQTASHPELSGLIRMLQAQRAKRQKALLEIFRDHDVSPHSDTSKAIAGLIEGGENHLANVSHPPTRDLMMIAHCFRIAHYGVAAFEIATSLARQLRLEPEAHLLRGFVAEEKAAAEGLNRLEPEIFAIASSQHAPA